MANAGSVTSRKASMILGLQCSSPLKRCPPDHEQGIVAGLKCLLLAMISSVHSTDLGDGRAVAMTAQSHKTAEEEYEEQVRILVRIVSASTLGLLAFAAGLLIGTFLFL
ncbi:hypothetical protein UB31_33145 [Bradyrhizobium sp. LTSP849]|nr:hypothetical protein UB31_33145 [Bradyrhizobium sp. LTSP849]